MAKSAGEKRYERLAAALRANLKRRKARARLEVLPEHGDLDLEFAPDAQAGMAHTVLSARDSPR